MIVVKLMGGLGNQMFQYAYAMSLAKEYDEDIIIDSSFYRDEKRIALDVFQIGNHENWTTAINEKERVRVTKAQKKYRILQKAKRVLLRTEELGESWFKRNVQKGYYFNFDPYYYRFIKTDQNNKYIYGYFQSEKYFSNCSDLIKKTFQLSVPLSENAVGILDEINNSNSVALHIRLGDYKKLRNFYLDVCTPEYYKKALDLVIKRIANPKIFVFTNDISGVRQVLSLPQESVIVDNTKDYEDFELIRNCKHVILSNSSFSWWASYLNQNENKLLIGPTPWFSTLKKQSDIYTSNIIKIQV